MNGYYLQSGDFYLHSDQFKIRFRPNLSIERLIEDGSYESNNIRYQVTNSKMEIIFQNNTNSVKLTLKDYEMRKLFDIMKTGTGRTISDGNNVIECQWSERWHVRSSADLNFKLIYFGSKKLDINLCSDSIGDGLSIQRKSNSEIDIIFQSENFQCDINIIYPFNRTILNI